MKQVSDDETALILSLAEKNLGERGDFVEFGCFEGDTSILLAELLKSQKSDKKLWIYDSFEGLPEKSAQDFSVIGEDFKKGELFVTKRDVKTRFLRANLPLPQIKKAWFDELSADDLPEKIGFAFLDGDLYESIKTSFSLVIPRLEKRGIIVVHDYSNPALPGVEKAVAEFLKKNPDFSLKTMYGLAILTRD